MNNPEHRYRELASRALVAAARQLRQRETPAERRLWACLRGHRLAGLKFRRQHPVAGTHFVVDFYCHQARLAVELDGEIHQYQQPADQAWQQALEDRGLQVLRFGNDQIETALGEVLVQILVAAQSGAV